MEEWFSRHIGKFMSGFIAVTLFAGSLIGYIYTQDKKAAKEDRESLYGALKQEIIERKSADKELSKTDDKLNVLIQTKLDIAVFNTHLTNIEYIKDDVDEMKGDVKIILRNTN
ncbi:MAG: hypothetical protein ACEPOW_13780 [Bacteroidales bacterium]